MSAWSTGVAEPFASDRGFWTSVGASMDAFATLVLAVVLTVLVGALGAVAFVVPLALLVRAGVTGRASARRSRTAFDDAAQWRAAERDAVAHAMRRALLRPRW